MAEVPHEHWQCACFCQSLALALDGSRQHLWGGDNMSDAAFLAATEDHVRVVHEARRIVRQILADGAGLSGQEVLRRLDELVVDASAKAERVTVELVDEAFCRHCGHSITRVGDSA
jgi:hypothetical protein